MATSEDGYRHLLLDPGYWIPRLRELTDVPQPLVQVPRSDLSRPGIEVLELRVATHDGESIRALLARSAFHRDGARVHLRTCDGLETCAIDWKAVENGTSDVVFPFPGTRRLEDRVLDVLCLARTVCALESIECSDVRFFSGRQTPPDEFVIADWVRDRDWFGVH